MNESMVKDSRKRMTEGELADAEWLTEEEELYKQALASEAAGTLRLTTLEEEFTPQQERATVTLAANDGAFARQQAEACGLTYEAYLAQVLHKALVNEQQLASPPVAA